MQKKIYIRAFFFIVAIIVFALSSNNYAKTRLCVCVLADDTPGNFMGGSSLGSGLWVSDDTGKTFIQYGWKHGKTYSMDMAKNSHGKVIYIARGDGLLATTDAGLSWRMLTDWRQTEVMDVKANQEEPSDIAIITPHGNWRSKNAGKTWKIETSKVITKKKDGECSNSVGEVWATLQFDSMKFIAGQKGVVQNDKVQNCFSILNAPRNSHALGLIGNQLFIGSLDFGLWSYALGDDGASCKQIAFPKGQIWSIHTYEIE